MKDYRGRILSGITATISISALSAGASLAQTAPAVDSSSATQLDEIVVTAQKRPENVQDVPLSVAVFGQEALANAGVTRINELQRIAPGLQVTRGTQAANQRVQIRGVGTSGNNAVEPSVGLFVDGVYVPRPAALMGSMIDLAAVEVLRGPQGTLFGRNTTMGVISVRSNSPDFSRDGEASVRYGSWESYGGEFVYNLPLSETFALRVAAAAGTTDGPARNIQTGGTIGAQSDAFIRLGARWNIADNLSWVGKFDHLHITSDGSPYSVLLESSMTPAAIANWRRALDPDGASGPLTGPEPDLGDASTRDLAYYSDSSGDDSQIGFTSDLTWDLAGGYALRLVNGYRDWRNEQRESDVLLSPYDLATRNGVFDSRSASHELQLISPERALFNGRFDFVAGLYAYDEDYLISDQTDISDDYCNILIRNFNAPLAPACLAGPRIDAGHNSLDQSTESYAAFGQGTVHLTDALDLVLGVRWTSDDKQADYVSVKNNPADLTRINEVTALAFEDAQTTYRIGMNWRPSQDVLIFASYSTGYKAGGFESSASTQVLGQARIFDPETVDNIELGAKTAWFDNALVANATIYRTTIDDFQVRSFDGIRFITRNAAKLRQQGVEFDTRWRVNDRLTANLAATYLDSEFLDYPDAPNWPGFSGTRDATGERAGYSPEWQGTFGLQYADSFSNGWRFTASGNLYFVTDQNTGAAGDNNPQNDQAGYQLLGGRLTFTDPSDRYDISIYGSNLTSESYCATSFTQPFDSLLRLRDSTTGYTAIRCTAGMPRYVGAELRARF